MAAPRRCRWSASSRPAPATSPRASPATSSSSPRRSAAPCRSSRVSALTIVLTLVGLAVLDWRFLLAACCAVPIQVLTVRWYLRRAGPLYAAQRVAVGARSSSCSTRRRRGHGARASGARATQHAARVAGARRATVGAGAAGVRLQTRLLRPAQPCRVRRPRRASSSPVSCWCAPAPSTVGTATAAALYFHRLFNPINALLASLDDAQSAAASLARLVGVVDLPAPPRPPRGGPPHAGATRARLAGVRHAYRRATRCCSGVDLDVAPGERVALVGASGAGKTTLAKLVAGMHPPTAGRSARRRPLADSARASADGRAVTQEVHVFAGPLADDLRLARPDATDDELRAALDGSARWTGRRRCPTGSTPWSATAAHRLTAAGAAARAGPAGARRPAGRVLDEATAEAGSAGARVLERAAEPRSPAHRAGRRAPADPGRRRRPHRRAGRRPVSSTARTTAGAAGGAYAALWESWRGTRCARPSSRGSPSAAAASPGPAPRAASGCSAR